MYSLSEIQQLCTQLHNDAKFLFFQHLQITEMEPVGSNYKSKKKREYRRRKRKQTEMEPAKLNDMEFIAETSISNSPDPHQTIADKNEEKNLSASQEQHFHLIGNLEQPVNKDYDEISSQCSSSISELGAELDAAGLWRPEDDQEIAYSLPSSVSLSFI